MAFHLVSLFFCSSKDINAHQWGICASCALTKVSLIIKEITFLSLSGCQSMVQLCLKVSTWDSTYRLQSCQWHINQVPLELQMADTCCIHPFYHFALASFLGLFLLYLTISFPLLAASRCSTLEALNPILACLLFPYCFPHPGSIRSLGW